MLLSQVSVGPHPEGTPSSLGWGVPPSLDGLDEVTSRGDGGTTTPYPESGYPLSSWLGCPLSRYWGTPIVLDGGAPPPGRQSNTASTCYMAGGMPFAFTKEDFLVWSNFIFIFRWLFCSLVGFTGFGNIHFTPLNETLKKNIYQSDFRSGSCNKGSFRQVSI